MALTRIYLRVPPVHQLTRSLAMYRRSVAVSLVLGALFVSRAASSGPDGPDVPNALVVPPGHRQVLKAVGKGVQIYKSVESPGGKLVWALEAPLANLYGDNGEIVGCHYEGPSWEATDGSLVVRDNTEPVKSVLAPAPEKDIPWLLVKVKADGVEAGAFSKAVYVQRLRTSGGKEPPNSPKRRGTKIGVPYTALYIIYEKP
jgi:Protein of unknown function (DUF3455)